MYNTQGEEVDVALVVRPRCAAEGELGRIESQQSRGRGGDLEPEVANVGCLRFEEADDTFVKGFSVGGKQRWRGRGGA